MSFKHKHKVSEAAEHLSDAVFTEPSQHIQAQEIASLIPSTAPSSATTVLRKTPSKSLDDKGSTEQTLLAAANTSAVSGPEPLPEAHFFVRGTRVRASLTRIGLQLTAVQAPVLPCVGRAVLGLLPFDEMLSAGVEQREGPWASTCCTGRNHVLVIHTIRRSLHNKSLWRPRAIKLSSADAELVVDWTTRINSALKAAPHRPRSLLVILNPYGGAKKAVQVWDRIAAPVFDRAGIHYCKVVTEREGHAREVVERLTFSELQSYDGVIAVGGDGLFQEALNGVLALRARGDEAAATAKKLRLGHIPAGSTDAVAYSLNGTRSEMTAALHIALGDRTPLDVMRVDTGDGHHRFAVCVASYGYMGDLMKFSEKLRWMGPPRYNTAGTITLLRGKAYRARISYKPADASRFSMDAKLVCRSQCNLCRTTQDSSNKVEDLNFTKPATEAVEHGIWKTIEGDFKGIMAVVSPCRSDRSTLGLFPYGHLNDGRLHLILVRNCSVLQYLRFLASIPQTGVEPGAFPYVDVIDVTAVQVTPIGEESCWNVDGELLADNRFTGEVHRGLLDVFARGVE